MRSHPLPWFSFVMLSIIFGIEAATHFRPAWYPTIAFHTQLSWEYLEAFQLHRLALSPLVQTTAGCSGLFFIALLLLIPFCELRTGWKRTAAIFFLGDWLSTLPILLVLRIVGRLGDERALALASQPDSGSSSAAFACAAALAMTLPGAWRLAAIGTLFAGLSYWALLFTRQSDVQHLLAAAIGAGLMLLIAPRPKRGLLDAYRRETKKEGPPMTVPP